MRHLIQVEVTYLREASALSVQLNQAMRRPPSVERTTSSALAHFFMFDCLEGSSQLPKEMEEKLKSHFLSLYCMIVSDGDVAISELNELYRIAQEHYGLSSEEINKAILAGGSALYIPESTEEKIKYLYDLAMIAVADGIDNSEKILLKKYATLFGFMDENVDEIVQLLLDQADKQTPVDEILKLAQ